MKNEHLKVLVAFCLFLAGTTGIAQIVGTSAYIYGDNVEIGINDAGHEGAPYVATSNNRSNQALGSPVYFGFVANPQLDGWTDYDGDFFTPGSPENGFGLEIDGVNYSNNASGTLEQIPGSITGYTTVGDCIYVDWDGSVAGVDVHIVYRLITTELYYTTEVTLTNTGADLTDVYYYRNVDPDNNVTIGGGYGTQNTIVAQPTPECEKALVTAEQTTPWDSYIGFGAIGENFRVSYGGFANRDASNIWNGVGGLTGGVGSTAFADQAISLAYLAETLETGVPETFRFTVVLDAAQIDAAIASLYYFDYLGSGGIIDECAPVVDTAQTCAGNPITISVDGPSAEDYDWTWSPPDGLSTTIGPTTDASPFATTTYTVTGTPAPVCLSATIEKTIIVEVTPSPIIEIVDPGSECGDFDLTTLTINNLEGSPFEIEYYSVIPDSIDQVVGLWGSDFMSSGDVVYLLMWNPATGCYDVELVDIDFSGGAIAGPDNAATLCNDAGSSLDLNTLLVGADPGGMWEETSAVASGGFDAGTGVLTATDVDEGVYTFEYIALGLPPCENDTAVMTITINQEPLAGLDATISLCNTPGTTTDLDDLLDGNNAVGVWAETTASGQFTVGTGVFDASDLPAGDYTFTYTVTGLAPCVDDIADFTVTILPNPVIDAGVDFAVCDGEEATLSGSGAGIGGSYTWDGGVVDGVEFIPVATATYTVTGTDANGCMGTDDIVVTVNALPVIDAGPDEALCDGDDVTLAGAGAGVGGAYAWTGGITDGVAFTPLATMDYTVTGTDANGCESTDLVTVTVNPLPAIDAGADIAVCDGDMVTLSGAGGVVYDWTGGVVDGVAFTPAATATYTVTGTDANECVNTDDVEVIVNDLPVIDAGDDDAVCDGEDATLFGSGAGVGGSYAWTGGVVDAVPFTPVATTTYTVTGTDVNGCENTDDVLVTVNPLPAVSAGADVVLCEGEECTLSGSGAGFGGAYDWTGGAVDGVTFTPLASAIFTVTGTDENGCSSTDDMSVTVNPLPVIDAGSDVELCIGDGVVLSGSGAGFGGTYVWDGGVTNGVSFTPGVTADYTVIGTTSEGCSSMDDVTVTVHALPDVSFMGDNLTGCAPLNVNFSNLLGGDMFDWSFGDGSISSDENPGHTFVSAGTFDITLTVTSAEGCVNTVTYNEYVDLVQSPEAAFVIYPYEVDVMDTRVDFDNQSIYADNYTWTFGDGAISGEENPSHEYEPIGNRNYTVTLTATNSYGCEDVAQQSLTVDDVLLYHIPNAFTPDGDLFNETFQPVFVSGLDIYDFHLMIFDRWGELVFESFDASIGWDGYYGRLGLVQDGTYIWKMEFGETMSDKRHYEEGHVTLIK